jgi:hypothetical protein
VQLSYYRGESRFSDHRPVCGTFAVEVEVLNKATKRRSSNADLRIDAEELLPTGKGKGNVMPTACIILLLNFLVLNINKNILCYSFHLAGIARNVSSLRT